MVLTRAQRRRQGEAAVAGATPKHEETTTKNNEDATAEPPMTRLSVAFEEQATTSERLESSPRAEEEEAAALSASRDEDESESRAKKRKSRVSFGPHVESPKPSRDTLHKKARISPAVKAKQAHGPLEDDHWLNQPPQDKRRTSRRSSTG